MALKHCPKWVTASKLAVKSAGSQNQQTDIPGSQMAQPFVAAQVATDP